MFMLIRERRGRARSGAARRQGGARLRTSLRALATALLGVGLFGMALPVLPADASTCVTSCTIWNPSIHPTGQALFNDGIGVEVGVEFTSSVGGFGTGLRFYKDASMNGATHLGHLWTAGGTMLAQATFTENASGWQQVRFPSPVPISASTTYVASYYAPDGRYFATPSWPYPSSNPPLTANLGAYHYPPPSFPDTLTTANYWVDVVFQPTFADLSVTKDVAPNAVPVGSTFPYTVQVTNAGPSAATGVVATDTRPAE
jgi:uncharacterized repeat protein (TIGR01451 family)